MELCNCSTDSCRLTNKSISENRGPVNLTRITLTIRALCDIHVCIYSEERYFVYYVFAHMCRGTVVDTRVSQRVYRLEAIFYVPVIKREMVSVSPKHSETLRTNWDLVWITTYSCVASVNVFSHRNYFIYKTMYSDLYLNEGN